MHIALIVVYSTSPVRAKINVIDVSIMSRIQLTIHLEKEARNLYGQEARPSEKELEVVQEFR
jgi:hypothetical protein